jgi:hypothetical protein
MDIPAWLRDLGLERYEQAFRDNEIDAEVLTKLTADDLIALGVIPIGHRRKLLGAIADLNAGPVPGGSAAVSRPPLGRMEGDQTRSIALEGERR